MSAALAAILSTAAGMAWLLSVSAKAALLLAASWLGAVLLRRGSAAARHQIWALGVAGALLLPLLCWALQSFLPPEAPASDAGRSLVAATVFVTGGRTTGAGPEGPSWLAVTWAAGVLLVSLRFLRGHLAARRLSRAAEPARAEAWLSAWREATAQLAITGTAGLGRSEAIASPMTIGVLRPRVLLPAAADAWSPERLRAVLVHELGHVRRRDTLVQLGAQLACALYWWNPLAWLAAARLRIEREHACDDLVLGAGVRPSSYATDLLEVARGISRGEAVPAGAIRMLDPSYTEVRLLRILDPAAPRRPLRAWLRLAAGGVTVALAVTLAFTSSPALLAPPGPSPAAPEPRAEPAPPGRAARGALSLGDPYVDVERLPPPAVTPEDTLDLSLVSSEVGRHLGDLKQCFEQRLLVHPELSGEVVIHWTITTDGGVSEQCITRDTLNDDEVRECVNKLVEESRFPAPRGGPVRVSLPFVFSAAP